MRFIQYLIIGKNQVFGKLLTNQKIAHKIVKPYVYKALREGLKLMTTVKYKISEGSIPSLSGVRFGVRAISLNCVDLRGPITQKHLYCVEFLRIASRFDSYRKSLPLRIPRVPKCTKMLKTNVLGIFFAQTGVPKCTKMYPLWVA